uniref:Uncharacterized protein n=1 Tax=Romanomermis culicivorax TaxID=13658 RepID=A0A915JE21_ROMCU
IDEPTTSQQTETTSEQQKSQQTVREYKVPYRRHSRQRTPPEQRYPSVPTAPTTAQIQPRTTDELMRSSRYNENSFIQIERESSDS